MWGAQDKRDKSGETQEILIKHKQESREGKGNVFAVK